MENQLNDSVANSFLSVIGRMGTNRLKLELQDDAKDKADSVKFEYNHILTKKFLECRSISESIGCEYYFGTSNNLFLSNHVFIFNKSLCDRKKLN
jgi:hypothetical protein